jgi:ribonuclease D
MNKILYNKYDKKAINALPVVRFTGRVITVVSPGETERAVDYLLSQNILGVDTETRPSFKKGHQYTVSLLQVSTLDTCFLFRLNYTGMTPAIIRLLEDTKVPKIGLSWHDDILSLSKLAPFKPGYFIDLQKHVGELGIEDKSLQKLYANLYGQKIMKREQLSNWEHDILTDKQKSYAATDAWACVMLYMELTRLLRTGEYELRIVEPVPEHQETTT